MWSSITLTCRGSRMTGSAVPGNYW